MDAPLLVQHSLAAEEIAPQVAARCSDLPCTLAFARSPPHGDPRGRARDASGGAARSRPVHGDACRDRCGARSSDAYLVLAFQCDLTRVACFTRGSFTTNVAALVPSLAMRTYHDLSHTSRALEEAHVFDDPDVRGGRLVRYPDYSTMIVG
jgi:hypothetical protein